MVAKPRPEPGGLPATARAADVLALGLLALLAFLSFAGELVLGAMPMDLDMLAEAIPVMAWLGQTARAGDSPLWTPGILGGFPLAFGQYTAFDPLEWMAALALDPNRATALVRLLYLFAAGAATYVYARTMGLSPLSSLLAATGYQLTTEAVAMPTHGNSVRSLFLLPTLLLSIELATLRGPRWAGLAAAAVGIAMATGGAYVAAIALLSAGLYTLVRALLLWGHGSRGAAARLALSMGAAVSLGLGLAAFRLLPTLAVTAESVRTHGLSLAAAATGSPGVLGLLAGYLMPLTRLQDLGNRGEFYAPSFVGPALLLLAVAALRWMWRTPVVALWSGLALFNLLASLGDTGPLFGLLHEVPTMEYYRGPQRFSTASAFFLSMLAACALHRGIPLADRRGRLLLRAVAAVATALVCTAMAGGVLWLYGGSVGAPLREFAEAHRLGAANPLRPRIALALAAFPAVLWLLGTHRSGWIGNRSFGGLCIAGTAVLLLVANAGVTLRQQQPSGPPATARFLQQDGSLFRVMSGSSSITLNLYLLFLAGGDPKKVDPEGPREVDFRYRYSAETLVRNFPLQFGVQSVDGHALLQSTRQAIALAYLGSFSAELTDLDEAGGPAAGRGMGARLGALRSQHLLDHLPVLRAFNVKYVLGNLDLRQHSDVLRLAFTSSIPMLDPGSRTDVYVYEVLGALPRAFLVPSGALVGDPEEALDALLSERVDPTAAVLLEQRAPAGSEPRLNPARSTLLVTAYRNTEVSLEAETDGSGFLVLNDAYHPGWRAWVDGNETTVYPANGWVRAVPIEAAGRHTVRFAYTPPLLSEGVAISLASLAILALALLPAWGRPSLEAAQPGSRLQEKRPWRR